MTEDPFVGKILSCQTGRATSELIYNNSQSGGVTTSLLVHLFETRQIKAAIVTTMKTGIPPRGDVVIATSSQELLKTQKSKYVPIPILSVLPQLKNIQGALALVGLPCHIHGLLNIFELWPELRSKIFIIIGLICDRVMTNASIDFLSRKATSTPVTNFIFRDKNRPAYPGNVVVKTIDNKEIILNASYRMAMKDFFTPVRCRLCFDKLNIFSDIVVGDPHGIPGQGGHNGETLILSRTHHGKELIQTAEFAQAITTRPESSKIAIAGQMIDLKRMDWEKYMVEWINMGMRPIETPIPIDRNNLKTQSSKHLKSLKQSLKLDTYPTRSKLLDSGDKWFVTHTIKKKIKTSFQKLLFIIKNRTRLNRKTHDDN